MRLPFQPLPGFEHQVARPAVDVVLEGLPETGLTCLVDTGSLGNRFASWAAKAAGIPLNDAPVERIGVGGLVVAAVTSRVSLRLGDYEWVADVSFCDPWPWGFHLLGQEGFFRYFHVCFDAVELTMDVEPAAK